MGKRYSNLLFNFIAPTYGLFYEFQKKHYDKILDVIKSEIDLTVYHNMVDVGCGTGALCSVLNEKGISVTGIDPAERMLEIARNKLENQDIVFINANVLEALPFQDKAFDISIASYVAHGLKDEERKKMYAEMSRVTKYKVIIYDYNQNRNLLTTIIEWLERGDYFKFIKVAENEMRSCIREMKECFFEVKVIDVDSHASWYICTPA
ncbi:class I SAM-dependent methyltransferase [Alkalibacter mobilis]|uniref:class I SAM-dependent methyltransferase n=1 Tax=Alkalibacter mobilis TaxID=2787712 RepID=UPI00189C7A09|nr:class I SAM-dependent methyltransferase [Alkalibacter mobilis]MBF7096788.1 class I SAM-dependent methyltransferase [Alkalibacter mobilis]